MKKRFISGMFMVLFFIPQIIKAQSIVTTRHNLSVSGPGSVKATSESQICIFCHSPHTDRPQAPLWNRNSSGATYTLYSSSTLNSAQGQPNGSSILCLSCHDGTIALGNVINPSTPISMTTGKMPLGNLTTDLSNDHPISFIYDAALAAADKQLKTPPLKDVKLDAISRLQCTTCHDPHKNVYTKFLVSTNDGSALCLNCHDRAYWGTSSHNISNATWNGSGKNPWAHIELPYPTVARNACENCHDPHNANGKTRLLKYNQEENNCLDCHSGTVASSSKNIATQLAKPYKHNVAGYLGIHDQAESPLVSMQHVECVDCHNPHASNTNEAAAPAINGANRGVNGIDHAGKMIVPAVNGYEVCYKCHAGNTWSPAPATARVIIQNNCRLEFAASNPSFHPIVGARNNTEITGNLITPNSATTVLYCTACHSSDGTGSPQGPHGSTFNHILKYQCVVADGASSAQGTVESPTAYALCYSCHNRNNIINDVNTFPTHKLHIVDQKTPCNTCHDPHGISGTQGNSTNNSNLINFRTGVVTPSGGQIKFIDAGIRHGSCQLTCHGKDHNPKIY